MFRCKPGYRRPRIVRNPYHGELIEKASKNEYEKGYNCEKIGYIGVLTQNLNRVSEDKRWELIGRFANIMAIDGISNGTRTDPLNILKRMRQVFFLQWISHQFHYPSYVIAYSTAYGKIQINNLFGVILSCELTLQQNAIFF